jgi:hypothetical protein
MSSGSLFGCGVFVFAIALCALLFYGYAVFNRSYAASVTERPGFGLPPTLAPEAVVVQD